MRICEEEPYNIFVQVVDFLYSTKSIVSIFYVHYYYIIYHYCRSRDYPYQKSK